MSRANHYNFNNTAESPEFSASGSRLLSLDSPQLATDSSFPDQSLGDGKRDDLSFSELSMDEHTILMNKPFSLLAPQPMEEAQPDEEEAPVPEPSTPPRRERQFDGDDDIVEDAPYDHGSGDEGPQGVGLDRSTSKGDSGEVSAARREEKLRSDIFILRKLNSAFEQFNEALQDTQSANERITTQLGQTDALIDKYIKILGQSEDYARLIFDDGWGGFSEDYAEAKRIAEEQEEKKRAEAERRMRKAEEERLAREQREQQEQEERERLERAQKAKPTRGVSSGVRGVRGTRASMRGAARGGASSSSRQDVSSTSSSSNTRGSKPRQSSIPMRARGHSRPPS